MTINGTNLNGYYKIHYGEKQKPIPAFGVVQKLLPFQRRAKTGKTYNEPIFTKRSHGVTFAKSTARTAYALAAARSLQSEEASISGAEIILRENVAYGALAASEGGEQVSFGSAFDEAVLGIEESHRFYVESLMLYGRTSVATIETTANVNATSTTITVTKQSWAVGLWAQMENALVDIYDAVDGTKINTTGSVTVTSLSNVDTRKILLTAAAADITAIDAGAALSYVIVFVAASGEVMDGIDKIITNTGTLFGISAATNSVWRANTLDCGGVELTMSKCLAGQTLAVGRGGMGEMTYLLNPMTWQDVAEDQAALRRHGEASTKMVNGAETIEFNGTGGKIIFAQHPMVKCGDAFGIQAKHWIRGGESDLVSKLPGANNDDFFVELADNAGFQMRNFSSQFIYCRKPSAQVKLYNIVPRQLA